MKYETHILTHAKDIDKVKVLADRRTEGRPRHNKKYIPPKLYKGIIIAIYIIITLVCIHEHHPRIKQILLCSCLKLFHTCEYPNFVIFYEFIFVNPEMLYQSFWF